MTDTPEIPFEEWDGTRVQHLTVSPEGTVYVVPSGAHERLHRFLVGDCDPTARLSDDEGVAGGMKVDLVLVGWPQLQSDKLTDRINIDAPDGFTDDALVRRFAALHDAGSAYIAFYPSTDIQKSTNPQHVSLSHSGARVPVAFE
jgi:hypothetical protein